MSEPSTRCYLSPTCELGPHAADENPCGQSVEQAGEPCRYCGEPCPPIPERPEEGLCLDCWTPANIPTIKGLLALYGLSVDPVPGSEQDG